MPNIVMSEKISNSKDSDGFRRLALARPIAGSCLLRLGETQWTTNCLGSVGSGLELEVHPLSARGRLRLAPIFGRSFGSAGRRGGRPTAGGAQTHTDS